MSFLASRLVGLKQQLTPFSFSLTTKRFTHEYAPRFRKVKKAHKGRVPVRTGGSMKGSTVRFGDYGLRLKSEGVRLTAKQLQEADNAIMRVIRSVGGQLWKRLVTSIAVCEKGNETRMGKGKGAFDHWAVRVPTGKVLFEIAGEDLHEKVARDVFRKAGDKLPGVYEIIKKGEAPRVGLKAIAKVPAKKNVVAQMAKNPSKEALNELKAKSEQYRVYRGF